MEAVIPRLSLVWKIAHALSAKRAPAGARVNVCNLIAWQLILLLLNLFWEHSL